MNTALPTLPRADERRRRSMAVRLTAYALVLLISLVDWLTAAGIVVGILLTIPIFLSSAGDEPEDVLLVSAAAALGFVLAALYGRGPISPPAVWVPNRLFVAITIVASYPLALRLQRRRVDAEAARARAESARDVSRLLQSLMAHDLRAPLALAMQAMELSRASMVEGCEEWGLLDEVEGRLSRSLESVDHVLAAARSALETVEPEATELEAVDIAGAIGELVSRFQEEARRRERPLRVDAPARRLGWRRVDGTVLRQVLSILLENALRYADPGPIRISASATARELRLSVEDSGPGYSVHRAEARPGRGAGMGLKLSRLLAARAGGTLALEKDDPTGSTFVLRLPVHAGPGAGGGLRRRIARRRGVPDGAAGDAAAQSSASSRLTS